MVGSCVLLRIHDHVFAISAKHVFDESRKAQMYIGVERGFLQIENDIIHYSASGGTPNVQVDVAFTDITNILPSRTQTDRILNATDTDPNEVCSEKTIYLGVGFPATRVDTDFRKRHVKADGISSSGIGKPGHCEPLGFTPFTHIAMEFSKRKMWVGDKIQQAPKPHGMSGGGLFRFDSIKNLHDSDAADQDKLIGVMIEYHQNRSVIVATNIVFALEAIRHSFPQVSAHIPTPTTVRLNLQRA